MDAVEVGAGLDAEADLGTGHAGRHDGGEQGDDDSFH